jgi:membrane protein
VTGERVDPASGAAPDADEGATLRERWEEPIARATALTKKTLAWFPIRVWRHFLQHNGFLLAASISYQALFAIFAVIYVAFAAVGVWLGGSAQAVDHVIALVNRYIPGIIAADGLVTPEQVKAIAVQGSGALALTGAVAVIAAIWTATGFVTFARRAVRDIFALPFDRRNYLLLKARDLFAAVLFGIALVIGSLLGVITTGLLDTLLSLVGITDTSIWFQLLARVLSLAVAFAINAAALAGLFRFLAGTSLPWRTIWPGALLGGGGMGVLQVGVAALFVYTPTNPLLATFSVLIGFLLWFRLVGIVMLVAASWIAVTAADHEIPLQSVSESDRRRAEHAVLLAVAEMRLRDAQKERATAVWFRVRRADRAVHEAESEAARLKASAPPPPKQSILYD